MFVGGREGGFVWVWEKWVDFYRFLLYINIKYKHSQTNVLTYLLTPFYDSGTFNFKISCLVKCI